MTFSDLFALVRRDQVITMNVIQKDSQGWLALGINSKGGMLGAEAVIGTRLPNGSSSTGLFLVNSFDEKAIIGTMNKEKLVSWAVTDPSISWSEAGNNLTFTRPMKGLDLTNPIFIVVAWHVSQQANFTAGLLPKHTGAGSFSVTLQTPRLGNGPDPLIISLGLFGVLVGLSVIVGVAAWVLLLRKKSKDYHPFVEGETA